MNPNTGAVAVFEDSLDAKRAGHTVPLSSSEAERLYQVPKAERPKLLAQLRGTDRLIPAGTPNRKARRAASKRRT